MECNFKKKKGFWPICTYGKAPYPHLALNEKTPTWCPIKKSKK